MSETNQNPELSKLMQDITSAKKDIEAAQELKEDPELNAEEAEELLAGAELALIRAQEAYEKAGGNNKKIDIEELPEPVRDAACYRTCQQIYSQTKSLQISRMRLTENSLPPLQKPKHHGLDTTKK